MKLLLYFLAPAIKFITFASHIDIKNDFISPGVSVYSGYYTNKYLKYFFFIGEDEPIRYVNYGDERLFPPETPAIIEYKECNLLVECFYFTDTKFVTIHIVKNIDGIDTVVKSIKIEIRQGIPSSRIKYPTYLLQISVHLNLNIDQISKNHPYIIVNRTSSPNLTEVFYTVAEEFMGLKFDGLNNPRYFLGIVHDYNLPVFVIFSKFEYLIRKCRSIKIKYSHSSIEALVNVDYVELSYNKTVINSLKCWSYIGEEALLSKTEFKTQLACKKKVDRIKLMKGLVYLDIAEKVSPDFFNIEKTSGYLELMGYTVYQEKFGINNISFVLDTKLLIIRIYTAHYRETIISVEVIVTVNTVYVIVNSNLTFNDVQMKRTVILEKNQYDKYVALSDDERIEKLDRFQKMFPIQLSIGIDDQEKRIYKNEVLHDDLFKFRYFNINEYDLHDNNEPESLRSKYVFGSLSEIDPYDVGNIPAEIYSRKYRIIKDDINCPEFILRNPCEDKPSDASLYEIYIPVT